MATKKAFRPTGGGLPKPSFRADDGSSGADAPIYIGGGSVAKKPAEPKPAPKKRKKRRAARGKKAAKKRL